MSLQIDLSKPLWQLTVGEFMELTKGFELPPVVNEYSSEEYVYGLDGLAQLIGSSKTTANTLRQSGKIDHATHQTGRMLIFNKKQVLETLKIK